MIAKNRICCKYTKDNFDSVKESKFKYCPMCGMYLNEFQLEDDYVSYKGEVYKIVGFNHFDDKKYMILMDSYGDMSKRVQPKHLKRVYKVGK